MEDFCKICDPKCKYTDCICNENFISFYDIYNELHSIDEKDNFSLIKPWSISTMTVCCSFKSKINLQNYRELYIEDNNCKTFYNCINTYLGVKYQNKNRVSLKIFSNGNIQLAGILNVMAAAYAVRKIYKRLCKNDLFITTPCITNLRICMINSDFKINKNIKQVNVCKLLDKKEMSCVKMYTFNPSKYPGINIKFTNPYSDNIITCSMFRPGSIIITGGNDIKCYKFVLNEILFLLKNNDILY